ncbi:MAG: Smr/MutS family protein [Rhodobacter sp.]|nr:Smr/MutS family protein [Rhodobacter sp.]
MRSKGSRLLTPEEVCLWERVKSNAKALHPERPDPVPPKKERPNLKPGRNVPERPVLKSIPEFRIGERSPNDSQTYGYTFKVSERPQTHPLRMDLKTNERLRRGKLTPEDSIDLHGMTAAGAFPELSRFIMDAHSSGFRLVLVITGKGRNSSGDGSRPAREGVLKRQVPHWLSAQPLSRLVLNLSEAHPRHGGSGAYYVYLRRRT